MPTTNTHAPAGSSTRDCSSQFAVLDGFSFTTSASEHWWSESQKMESQLLIEAVSGAEWMFDEWPWTKIDGGNIGAIQLPMERKAIWGPMRRLMKRPFEVCEQSYRPCVTK